MKQHTTPHFTRVGGSARASATLRRSWTNSAASWLRISMMRLARLRGSTPQPVTQSYIASRPCGFCAGGAHPQRQRGVMVSAYRGRRCSTVYL